MSYQALLFCPDERTAKVVTQVLSELDFSVETAAEPFAAVKKLMAQHFDAIVVDCENEQNATLLFKSARNSSSNQASLAVAVVEGQAGVAKAFRIGANLVLTKPINIEQSKGTLRVARGLLRKGGDPSKAAASTMTASTPAAPAKPAQSTVSASPGFEAPQATAAAKAPGVSAFPVSKTTLTPATPVSSVPPGVLESEPDTTPGLDATEAALLESMHDPAPISRATTKPTTLQSSATSKTYPWQPVAKSSDGPMAAALQKAAEAAGKTPAKIVTPKPIAPSAAVEPKPSAANQANRRLTSPLAGGQAAAPAPAKETPKISYLPEFEAPEPAGATKPKPAVESKPKVAAKPVAADAMAAPSFSTLDTDSGEEKPAGGKNGLIALAAVAVVAVAGYFGLTTLHSKKSQHPAPPVQAPAAPAPTTAATPALAAPAPEEQADAPAVMQAASTQPSPAHPSTPLPKPSPSTATPKMVAVEPIAEDKTVTIIKSQPLTVKSDAPRPAPAQPAQEQPVPIAPSALDIASGSQQPDLSAVASAPVKVPRIVPQVVNISQGVSQGLLIKKVQPVYPSSAVSMRIQGAVELQATISKTGDITNVKVLGGEPALSPAAVDAVRQWKYKPYYLNGEPVEVQTQVTINFRLPN
jgi:periplasmic protein TonB